MSKIKTKFNSWLEYIINENFFDLLSEKVDEDYETSDLRDPLINKIFIECLRATPITAGSRRTPTNNSPIWWLCEMGDGQKGSVWLADGGGARRGVHMEIPLAISGMDCTLLAMNNKADQDENSLGLAIVGFPGLDSGPDELIFTSTGLPVDEAKYYSALHNFTQKDLPKPLSGITGSHELVGDFLGHVAYGLAKSFTRYGFEGACENPDQTYEVIFESWTRLPDVISELNAE